MTEKDPVNSVTVSEKID